MKFFVAPDRHEFRLFVQFDEPGIWDPHEAVFELSLDREACGYTCGWHGELPENAEEVMICGVLGTT